jgi:hypothetical protein
VWTSLLAHEKPQDRTNRVFTLVEATHILPIASSMGTRALALSILILALGPSAWLAWTWRAMPHLALYHDDGIYWVCAKSLGSGEGYKIASLPGQPWQTKYPPLFPALLSLVWRINPSFPGNLPLAMLVVWLAMPVYLLMAYVWYKQVGLPEREALLLMLIAGFSPLACVFSIVVMPDVLFTALLLGSLILAEKRNASNWAAVASGVLAGLAYLARSPGIVLLLTVPLCFVLRSQWKRAATFVVCMLPFIAAWQWWVAAHLSRAKDLVTLYYTNYVGFQAYNAALADLPRIIWRNLGGVILSIGGLTFDALVFESRSLEYIVAAAAVAGVVRHSRRTGRWQYPAAGAGMIALLLVWHFPPMERFLMPLFPLLLLGLWTELTNFAATLRKTWAAHRPLERAMAGASALVLVGFAIFIVSTHIIGDFVSIPRMLRICESDLRASSSAYAWLSRNTPPGATLYTYQDPLVYLYTGRRALQVPIPPKLYYLDEPKAVERFVATAPVLAREQNLDYVLLTSTDYFLGPWTRTQLREVCRLSFARATDFREVFDTPQARVYRAIWPGK